MHQEIFRDENKQCVMYCFFFFFQGHIGSFNVELIVKFEIL